MDYYSRYLQSNDYFKIINTLRQKKCGVTSASDAVTASATAVAVTVADVSAASALPLSAVRELLPKAADEFSAHLQVTQSGEILYVFPPGFKSRYRGFGIFLEKAARICFSAIKKIAVLLFKIWIVVMLIGYFILFIALALASVVFFRSKSSGKSSRSSSSGSSNLFSIVWRIWFVKKVTKPRYGKQSVTRSKNNSRPMHKSVFSFVFGEGDPNHDWNENMEKAVISYIQANKGVICLAEYMAFTGENSIDAEKSILSFCARFGGSPEVTEEGTIVYRFDEILLHSGAKTSSKLSPPIKPLKIFSANSKTMNICFIVINTVNLIFGSYFLYNSLITGLLVSEIQYQTASYLYGFTHILAEFFMPNPVAFMGTALGIIPLAFSMFFWVIPAIRRYIESKENEKIKLSNFKRLGFNLIWASPVNVKTSKFSESAALSPAATQCRPKNIALSTDRVIKDFGALSNPDIEIDPDGETLYSFNGLQREKDALKKYRSNLNPDRMNLGKTIFDSAE